MFVPKTSLFDTISVYKSPLKLIRSAKTERRRKFQWKGYFRSFVLGQFGNSTAWTVYFY